MQNNQCLCNQYSYRAISCLLLVFLGSLFFSAAVTGQELNDHIFPPQAPARAFSNFDSKGFIINGKRTFLVSAGLEYARMPRQLWKDRLLKLKRGGFNCVEIYTIWNFHEPREGQFEFSGDHDLDYFLTLVKELGLYAIVRVGPYYCAEWDQGGYPLWLRFKKDLRVREDNPVFEKYVDRFFDRLLPIVFKHQIHKGGSVILVQLENEHPKGWGTLMPDPYFKHLQSKSLNLGMEVPYFFSGLHHATDPAGEGELDDVNRPNPWFSTEFWSMWYTQYGAKPNDAALYDRRTWKIIAHGGNGYNFYMAYGGSNFGYTNNDEDAASYDYGAAVGQAGDLRPIYYTFKRAGIFARSFEEILENSVSANSKYQYLTKDTALKVTARTAAAGDLIFLDNPGTKPLLARFSVNQKLPKISLRLAAGEIYPLVHHFRLNKTVMLDWALTRIYAVVKQNTTTTLLVEAAAAENLSLHFSTSAKPVIIRKGTGIKVSGQKITIHTQIDAALKPVEYSFTVAGESIRILVMNRAQLDKTWQVEAGGLNTLVTGVSYLSKVELKKNMLLLDAAYPMLGKKDGKATLYLEKGSRVLRAGTALLPATQRSKIPALKLSSWAHQSGNLPAAPGFDDNQWLLTEDPSQMGADGDLTNSAWYKTKLDLPSSGKYTLQVDGGDRGTAFIDGKLVASWKIREREVGLELAEGKHDLTIFTAHDGRDKMAAYLGPINDVDKKGLSGTAILKKGGPFIRTLQHWYFTKAADSAAIKSGPPVLDTLKGNPYQIGADAFDLKEGFGWFQTVIPAQGNLSQLILFFKSVDENATVFVNNKKILRHAGWNIPFELKITDPDVLQKSIVLSVFIENHSKEGGIDQPVKINSIGNGTRLKGWRMQGGPFIPGFSAPWNKLNMEQFSGPKFSGPHFFRSLFNVPLSGDQHLIWRVNTTGLGYGSVWVNGHNLGRYPEKNGDIGLYIPEPWLKSGNNILLIYDEDGKRPDQVTITSEAAAGSINYQLTTTIH